MKLWLKIAVVVLLLLLALLVQRSDAVAQAMAAATRPFLKGMDAVAGVVEYCTGYFPLGGPGRRELETLKQKNAELEVKLDRQQVFRAQNEGLRKLLQIRLPREWEQHYATIIARDPVTWHRRFRIGKGSAEGVRLGAAVLERQYLIGRVVEVARHSSTVATLADRDCRISVRLEKQDGVGVLAGGAGEHREDKPVCLVTYVPRTYQFANGEGVVTSGLSDVIPPGLRVGEVVNWDQHHNVDLSRSTYARLKFLPSASFEHFRFVTVVSKSKGTTGNASSLPSGL